MTDQQNSISNDIDPNAELTIDELDVVNGGRHSTIHPAKVTVPDLKLAISYS